MKRLGAISTSTGEICRVISAAGPSLDGALAPCEAGGGFRRIPCEFCCDSAALFAMSKPAAPAPPILKNSLLFTSLHSSAQNRERKQNPLTFSLIQTSRERMPGRLRPGISALRIPSKNKCQLERQWN